MVVLVVVVMAVVTVVLVLSIISVFFNQSIFQRLLQVRPGHQQPQRRIFGDSWSRLFCRPDAIQQRQMSYIRYGTYGTCNNNQLFAVQSL